jgi:RHS repeat-associated protein
LPEVIYTSEGNSYLHLPGVIMTENSEGEVRYLLSDGLGSVRQVVDETGQVVTSYEFDPYGNPVNGSGGDPYGFTGEWWENDLGLLNLRARWYMPETGTFLSRDPLESEPPYLYAEGNPINMVDPSGLCPPGIPECRGADGRPIDQFYRYGDLSDPPPGLFDPNPWYPTDLEPKPPSPNEMERYRRAQIMNYARRMEALRNSGQITDLEALARTTEFAAKLYDSNSKMEINAFVYDVGAVIVGHSGPLAPITVEGPLQQPPSEFTVRDDFESTGFAMELQDVGSNQLRHFWFAVDVEMCYPSEINKLQGILHETSYLSGTPRGQSPQDILLSFQGSGLGIGLDNGKIKIYEAGDWIRENLGPKY